MGILLKSMGVIQGYAIVAERFETCKNIDNRLKLVEIDNCSHIKNEKNSPVFMQKKYYTNMDFG